MLSPIGFPTSPSTATLRGWSIIEVDDDDGHRVQLLVGMLTDSRLRVTTQIEELEGWQVRTRSGSTYTLDGPPATAEQLEEQRTRRDALLAGRDAVDVTKYVIRQF
ncbi:hypothetical protein [Roseateles puraquae]|uniref:hypothetical protein n=1 Tax=Roseateles puraquae TaxID=431059 RepID=UPI0031D41C8A